MTIVSCCNDICSSTQPHLASMLHVFAEVCTLVGTMTGGTSSWSVWFTSSRVADRRDWTHSRVNIEPRTEAPKTRRCVIVSLRWKISDLQIAKQTASSIVGNTFKDTVQTATKTQCVSRFSAAQNSKPLIT